jgi:16S rRNA (cytidine1402-2'-O)-methyltransferase
MAGILYVVATPIGNLEDLSFRALRTLKEVDLIAAEDTRRTAKLLAHYAIRKSMVSLREHNERRETPKLMARLQAGAAVALVSDAGTPGVSDPGSFLVRSARNAGITVCPIPGPSAVMAALSASGESADEFVFMGYVPRSGALRTDWLNRLQAESRPVVFFEAPHRIRRLMTDIVNILVIRPIHLFRELTKINEISVTYTNLSAVGVDNALGEFVLVAGKVEDNKEDQTTVDTKLAVAVKIFDCLTNNSAFEDIEALRLASEAVAINEPLVRKAVKKARIEQRRREEALS